MRLSPIEFMALLFTGLAGVATAVQAYVSYEERGEVARAIVFAERIDACANLLAALEPFVAKAREDGRAIVAAGSADGRYSLSGYYYRTSAGNAGFDEKHGARLAEWRRASAGFAIVAPEPMRARLPRLDKAIGRDFEAAAFFSQDEMIEWLTRLEADADAIAADCRGML